MDEKDSQAMTMSNLTNSLLVELKTLSSTLKPTSKALYENNNKLLNEMLIAKDQDIRPMTIKLLGHFVQISQHKNFTTIILSMIAKVINCIKTMPSQSPQQRQQMQLILHQLIDIIASVGSLHKQAQDVSLRVIQTTFSLIDQIIVPYFNESILTRMYAVCFDYCKGISILQNISVSALFALTECLFLYGGIDQSFHILDALLQYSFTKKRFIWIKATDLRGLVWDLISTSIKCFTANHIIKLDLRPQTKEHIEKMYDIAIGSIFLKANKDFYAVATSEQAAKQDIHQFVRYFKAYLTFSTTLSIESFRVIDKEFIPFRGTIPKLIMICELDRNPRMYIFLEAISQLLLNQYDAPLSVEKGLVFMEIFSRISEQLCLCNQSIKVNWEANQYYLDKLCHQDPKIGDGDFVRLIKNTIFLLRQKFEKDTDLINCKKEYKEEMSSARSSNQTIHLPPTMGNVKKWEQFIKCVIKVVRYLSSLNFINSEDEEDPTRKIILQLQYWFLICPVSRAKNMILQELLVTANILTNKMQAVKVSQSVQIGSNILYGYFEDLDSTGLTIILKIMAGIKADWEEGKSFEELDEIYNLTVNVFTEERFIQNDTSFSMTIQALVQCSNSLLADIEQPKEKALLPLATSFKRLYKMLDYLIHRLMIIAKNNPNRAAKQWNFITAFFITLCFNKNIQVKEKGIEQIGLLVKIMLKAELDEQLQIKKEQDIMGLYLQLCKAQIAEIELSIVQQLKMFMPRIKQQIALMDGFRIGKIFSENTKSSSKEMIRSLHDMQEILIKECLFRILDVKYLRMILDGLQVKFTEKNQEYRLINLVWSIADHLRQLTPIDPVPAQFLQLWQTLFKGIWSIGQSSQQCETKQSAIHAITQILAEAVNILPLDFQLSIIFKYFQQLVLLLLGVLPNSIVEPDKIAETAKISLKNYIKMFKMLISLQNKNESQIEEIKKCLSSINQSITKFIQEHADNRLTGTLSLELLLELLNFIFLVGEEKGFDQYDTHPDLREMFQGINNFLTMCQQEQESGKSLGRVDLNSHLFKKKVKPMLQKVSESQALKKQGNSLVKQAPEA